jgi:hypothetical protein
VNTYRKCDEVRAEAQAAFEKGVLQHGRDSVALWVAWVRHARQEHRPAGLLIQRAVAALDGALADAFVAAVQSDSASTAGLQ